MIQLPRRRIRVRSQRIGINWVRKYGNIFGCASGYLLIKKYLEYLEWGVLGVLGVGST